MSVHYKVKAAPKKKRARPNGNTHARPLPFKLSDPDGCVRVGHWLTLLDITAPPFYRRLRDGKVPPPDGNDGRPFWRTSTVRKFLHG